MKILQALLTIIGALFALQGVSLAEAGQSSGQPDIILIMVDDMGFSDIGCYGGEISTPHIDRLASRGLRFTRFYNTSRCCPTRAALLTGLYSHQAGIGHMVGDYGHPSYQGYLNDRCVTIAEALKPAGYRTMMVGKWHVGSNRPHWPTDRGFDRYYGTPSGGGIYFKENFQTRKEVFVTLDDNKIDLPDDWYVTDAITDHALTFIDEAVDLKQPFFLYVAHVAPHWPLQARKEDIDKYRNRYSPGWDTIRDQRHRRMIEMGIVDAKWPWTQRDEEVRAWNEEPDAVKEDLALRMAIYAAQIDRVDQNVGRIVDKLEAHHRLQNTLILFLSDNGGCHEGGPHGFSRGLKGVPIDEPGAYASYGLSWAQASNTPFRRYKSWVHEGGISTPLIAHWPARIDPLKHGGELRNQVGHVIDILATCVDAAGATYPLERGGRKTIPLEGKSLIPAFENGELKREALFWEHQGNRAVRQGRWKLVSRHPGKWELYDLEADRTEQKDLAGKHPGKVAAMAAAYGEWAQRCGVQPWPVKKKAKR